MHRVGISTIHILPFLIKVSNRAEWHAETIYIRHMAGLVLVCSCKMLYHDHWSLDPGKAILASMGFFQHMAEDTERERLVGWILCGCFVSSFCASWLITLNNGRFSDTVWVLLYSFFLRIADAKLDVTFFFSATILDNGRLSVVIGDRLPDANFWINLMAGLPPFHWVVLAKPVLVALVSS